MVQGVNEGFDYGKLENARKLTQGNEYTWCGFEVKSGFESV